MQTSVSYACGNFLVKLTAEVPEGDMASPLTIALLQKGMLYCGQRVSDVDKILGAFTKDEAGKQKRKAGWKRGDVTYSEALAQRLKSAFEKLEVVEGVALTSEVEITEYVPTAADAKYTEERVLVEKHESKGDLEQWLVDKVGYNGPTHTEDEEDYAPQMLAAVRVFKQAAIKAAMAALA